MDLWNTCGGCEEGEEKKGKSVQVEDLEDMYVKNQFGIYVLNPKDVLPAPRTSFRTWGV